MISHCSLAHIYAGYFVKMSSDVKWPNVTSKSSLLWAIWGLFNWIIDSKHWIPSRMNAFVGLVGRQIQMANVSDTLWFVSFRHTKSIPRNVSATTLPTCMKYLNFREGSSVQHRIVLCCEFPIPRHNTPISVEDKIGTVESTRPVRVGRATWPLNYVYQHVNLILPRVKRYFGDDLKYFWMLRRGGGVWVEESWLFSASATFRTILIPMISSSNHKRY